MYPDKIENHAFCNFQKNLWKMIEMVLNMQDFTPGAIKHFKLLGSSLQNQSKDFNGNVSNAPLNRVAAISNYYQNYLNINSPANLFKENIVSINKEIQLSDYDDKISSFLKELKQYFNTHLFTFAVGCFLHGSLSTMDYTGFSDVDIGIIVKDEVMLNPKLLNDFKRSLKSALKTILKFDNLQHHGFFIIPEGFLNNYPKDYLPSEVFVYSAALSAPFNFQIREHSRPEHSKEKLLNMAKTVIKKASKPPMNLHNLKLFLSQFMLLPTLYLQAKGIYVYKKFSFDIVRKEFPEDWWVMEEVSRIRQEWHRPESKLFNTLVDTLPNPWMPSLIYKKMNWRIPDRLLERLTPELHGAMSSLAKKMSR